jgi:hypothetical protein
LLNFHGARVVGDAVRPVDEPDTDKRRAPPSRCRRPAGCPATHFVPATAVDDIASDLAGFAGLAGVIDRYRNEAPRT